MIEDLLHKILCAIGIHKWSYFYHYNPKADQFCIYCVKERKYDR